MRNSEIIHAFNEQRGELRPYGLTSEIWVPYLMKKPDRHNEIELNYLTEGSITYFFQGTRITIPARSLTMFWGLVPHQIVEHTGSKPYFVCTIPLSQFLEWRLPSRFVDKVLKGEIIIEDAGEHSSFDEFLLNNWMKDLSAREGHVATLLEMQARLLRMANRILAHEESVQVNIHSSEISQVESIAMFIAQNYARPIKTSDIGKEVGLHPDYANVVFKKTFGMSLNEYLIQERISHAQRKLVSTDRSITDILYECGFNSISSFNAAFRKINQCTPREFRKKYH
jgi:AraC family transcriptional regulator, melibiose operon regulatory protein